MAELWLENGRGRHTGAEGSRVSRPDQEVGPPDGTFGPTFISKKNWGLIPSPPHLKGKLFERRPKFYLLYHTIYDA